jgi:hypothetical protein
MTIRCKVCRTELTQEKDLIQPSDEDTVIEPCEVCIKQEDVIHDTYNRGYDHGSHDTRETVLTYLAHIQCAIGTTETKKKLYATLILELEDRI